MMLYLDTSALVKVYVEELGSSEVRHRVETTDVVAVSRIAWAELHAAVAQRARLESTDEDAAEAARIALASDWPTYLVLEVTQPVVERAGQHAVTFALRGFDAVQLATAYEAKIWSGETVAFLSFDQRLMQAAEVLGLTPSGAS